MIDVSIGLLVVLELTLIVHAVRQIAQGHVERRRRKAQAVVARLRADLSRQLDSVEEQNKRLQTHIRSRSGSLSGGLSEAIFSADLVEDLRAALIVDLRERAKGTQREQDIEEIDDLHAQGRALAGIMLELSKLALEIESREREWQIPPDGRQPFHRAQEARVRRFGPRAISQATPTGLRILPAALG